MRMRKKAIEIAWFKRTVLEDMLSKSHRCQPYETGGCLLGYWATPSKEIVITDLIGPGPNAKHSKRGFQPDHEWQTSKIATIYRESRYLFTYLGDWHSHPNRPNSLSWKDLRTFRKIASYAPARAPEPVMAIIGGNSPWTLRIWYLELRSLKIFSKYQKKEFQQIKFYE